MTFQLRNLLLRSAQTLLGPGNKYDASTRELANDLFRGLDGIDAAPGENRMLADCRAARVALAARIRNRAAVFDSNERRVLHGGDASVLNLAEGTPSAGGFLLPTLVFPDLLERLKFFGAVASIARVIETSGAAPLGLSTIDDVSNSGSFLAENSSSATLDFTNFGLATLTGYKFSSGIAPISYEILMDAAVDLVGEIMELFAVRLGRIQNQFFTTGTGTAQPQGVVTGAASGFVLPTGNTTSLTYAGLIQLYQSVDPAYRSSPNCAFMTNDTTLLAIKSLADTTNQRPLWLPDVLPQPLGSPWHGTLLGKPVIVNYDMANMAANAKPVLFGDFAQYAIRMVRGAAMMQLNDSAFATKGQSAWIMFSRADGRVLMPQAIRFLQNSAT